jgi:hypothetical protein
MMRRKLPLPLAVGAGVVGAVIGLRLVSADVAMWQTHGFTVGPEMIFVAFMVALFAAAAFVLSNRLLNGPKLTHDEWTLFLRPTGAVPKTYRDAETVRLSPLKKALTRWGYNLHLEVCGGEAGTHAAPDTAELVGPRYQMRERRLKHGRLRFQMTPAQGDAPAWGTVEVDDISKGTYGELAQYLIYELGNLIPGVEFKRSFSSLSPEATATLAPQLPDRPHYLPRSAKA